MDDELMDGWIHESMDGWNGWMDGWINESMDGWMDGLMDGCINEWMDGWMTTGARGERALEAAPPGAAD
eukprot:11180074-Lingulodinium_polyedra.AAC.1